MKPVIKNCVLGFQCSESWDTLRVLEGDSSKKHCDKCHQEILLCETFAQFTDAIRQGSCVAVDFEDKSRKIRVLGYPSGASSFPSFLSNDEE